MNNKNLNQGGEPSCVPDGKYARQDSNLFNFPLKRDSMGRYIANDGRMMPDYDRGSSYARRGEHYVRGHYSRSDGRDAYDDYMTQKQSYRSGKSEDCKRKMLAALEEHLDELTTEMSDMSKDAECREERDLVKRYVEKLRDML